MNRHYIDSNIFYSVGYDPSTGILEFEYKNGTLCCWLAVPAKVYQGLCLAPEVDIFFTVEIKNRYLSQLVSQK